VAKGSSESKSLAPLLQNLTQDSLENCPIGKLTKTDPESAAILNDLLAGDNVSVRKIHRVVRAENMSIGRDSLQAHRNRKCSCFDVA
jgi:hypothetical protein